MSVNRYKPHVLVLVEDDANRAIANGFAIYSAVNHRDIQVLQPAGGWEKVLDRFGKDYGPGMHKNEHRHMVLVLDFDDRFAERKARFHNQIPQDIQDRVFLLGTSSEPEALKTQSGKSLEEIGKQLAKECYDDTSGLWKHPLLKHNAAERERLRAKVRSFLFAS